MTLDEAIKHAEEVAEEKEKEAWEAQLQEEYKTIKSCKVCAKEHRQLANWLKELKLLREQKCEDAVSRQAVEKITWEEPSYTDPFNVLTEVREKVRALSPVTPQLKTGWIPVSERLPKKFSYVNCTCRSLIDDREDWVVETCYVPQPKNSPYSDWGNIPMLNDGDCEVVAWMYREIPKPYKAESEDK